MGISTRGGDMAVIEQPADVVNMPDLEWRSWLRTVTPFIDGDMVRHVFKDHSPEDYFCSEVIGDRPAFWVELNGMNLDGVSNYFTVHGIDWQDYRDTVYAVHTKKKSSSAGRTIEIAYWPHLGTVLKRLGYKSKEHLLKNQWDGTSIDHVGPVDLVTVTAFVHDDSDRAVGESGNDLLMMIEHEINAAWFREKADLEQEALREASEKGNPDLLEKGQAKSL
jgi:hypothetical protein